MLGAGWFLNRHFGTDLSISTRKVWSQMIHWHLFLSANWILPMPLCVSIRLNSIQTISNNQIDYINPLNMQLPSNGIPGFKGFKLRWIWNLWDASQCNGCDGNEPSVKLAEHIRRVVRVPWLPHTPVPFQWYSVSSPLPPHLSGAAMHISYFKFCIYTVYKYIYIF